MKICQSLNGWSLHGFRLYAKCIYEKTDVITMLDVCLMNQIIVMVTSTLLFSVDIFAGTQLVFCNPALSLAYNRDITENL